MTNLTNQKTSESETDEERKAAAAKIVHHLQDGVEALTDVLDNFKSPEIENRVKMRPTAPPLESPDSETELTTSGARCPTFVVTESQIASTSDDVAKPCTCSPLPFMDSSMISTMDYIDNDENIWQPRKMEEKTDDLVTTDEKTNINNDEKIDEKVESKTEQSKQIASDIADQLEDYLPKKEVVSELSLELKVVIPEETEKLQERVDSVVDIVDDCGSVNQENEMIQATNHRRIVAQIPPQKIGKKRIRVEDCVPAEYTSSLIVEILAKAEKERPLPPRTIDDLNKSLAAMSSSTIYPIPHRRDHHQMTKSCTGISPGSGSSSNSSGVSSSSSTPRIHPEKRLSITKLPGMGISSFHQRQNLTILETIIRTHPIWYLPHVGRSTANHFLRPMLPGCFIVRSSTRQNSMALTLRLPYEHSVDTDHYLIEKHGNLVKLEGSPHFFKSLPLLIEHYYRTNDELQCKLTLPLTILKCSETIDLQRLALMGQDFWTSELAKNSQQKRQISQPMMNSRGLTDEARKRHQKMISPVYLSTLTDQLNFSDEKREEKKSRKILPTKNSMLKKSQSENEGLQNEPQNNSSNFNSVSSTKSTRSTSKNHFLRNLFTSSNNSIQPSTSSNANSNSSRFYAEDSATSSNTLYGYGPEQQTSETNNLLIGSTLRRSFARLTSFKSNKPKSKDDANFNKMSAEAIKARQEAFRREKTDISAISCQRLAGHRNVNDSPTNQMFEKRNYEIHRPIIPGKSSMDKNAIQKCIEELKSKRMAGSNSPNSSPNNRVETQHSPQKQDNSLIFKEFGGFIQNNGKPFEVILRNKKLSPSKRNTKIHERLSYPNLNDLGNGNVGIGNLNDDDGKNSEIEELSTINEGLITPIFLRKNYGLQKTVMPINGAEKMPKKESAPLNLNVKNDDYTNSLYLGNNLKKNEEIKKQRQGPVVPQKPKILTGSNSFSTKPIAPARSLYSVVNPGRLTNNNNNSLQNWSEINSELKLKQKIAKVKPTPQQIAPSKMSSTTELSDLPLKKTSEYAQLSEFSYDADTSVGSFHSTEQCENDDDAVSVAGTVFNEPWDSNAWENLLEIAKYGDEKSNIKGNINNYCSTTNSTIEEEGSSSPIDMDDVIISCVESDSDEIMPSPEIDDFEQIQDSSTSFSSLNKKNLFLLENNRQWTDVSQRIPSEPSSKSSTFDPRKIKSTSMMNVTGNNSLNRNPTSSPLKLRSSSAKPPITDPGMRIQNYVEILAKDSSTVFGATLKRFIELTLETDNSEYSITIKRIRQFLNGMKNYLVKIGEKDLHTVIENESNNLLSNEFLNIDAILEAVLHKLLLLPIKNHLYHLMIKEYSKNGSLQLISENLQKIRSMKPEQLGFSENFILPDLKDMEIIKNYLRKMQNHYSPLKKLEHFLKALSIVYKTFTNNNQQKNVLFQTGKLKLPPADELIRWIIYILSKTSTINCEIESWYMWELLPQQLLTTGDAAYYLTTLFSSIHIIKNYDTIIGQNGILIDQKNIFNNEKNIIDAFLTIAIPDEKNGSIEYHNFPAVPQMNSTKLCRVIAHQFAITNPEDYGLYILFDGFETCLLANECPDAIRDQLLDADKPHLFAYKRHEAKIAWPKNVISTSSTKSSPETQPAFQLRPNNHVVQPSPIHKRRQMTIGSKVV